MDETTTRANLRPGPFCRQLLAAMDASEGRRKRRKRDTTPDALGMEIERDLLARATEDDPDPDAFEAWLLQQCLTAGPLAGATRATGMRIMDQWRMALAADGFRAWLDQGAPSDDVAPGLDMGLDPR
jgi:hypothetical protein